MLWQCQWQYWTAKRSLWGSIHCLWVSALVSFIYALVFPYILGGGPSHLCSLLVSMTTGAKKLTVKRSLSKTYLFSDSVDLNGGSHMPLVSVSLYMHWYFLIFSSICQLVSMTTLNWRQLCVKRSLSLWQLWHSVLTLLNWGGPYAFGVCILYMHWYFLIFSSICLLVSMTTFNSKEITLSSDSGDWGVHLPLSLNDKSHWTFNGEEITLCSDSVDFGGPYAFGVCIFIYALVFPYIFFYLPVSLNDNIEWWRYHSVLWQCWLGGSICLWVSYDNIEQCGRDHYVLWQCWPGGSICLWCLYLYICTGISLYFLLSAC